ncbi:hypothetical protein GCM10009769_16470 [Curtobacterium luteum]|uniref:Uncharacterized protein n=1 Tax=Curtobacterium luteum TaxID=33881 RepID=A0A8H9G9K1_9MICO|nr:hypothetical protein [Curtobacterium luteum]NUU50092.1 hypothetical protein [Curtobacterium luteum]GGK98992.1 hypothetical protein GCM10009769_16470 [Curtobacterium luteum]
MKALHVPTDRIYDPSEVTDETRAGPWRCAWPGCAAVLFHSRGTERKLASGGTTTVAAKFSCYSDSSHSADPHGQPIRWSGDPDAVGASGTPREHIHRLTDLPLPEANKHAAPSSTRESTPRTQYTYGSPLGGVRGLRAFSMRVAADEEGAANEQVRYLGIDYFWKQIAFAPTGSSFVSLDATIRAQFQRYRAYYVEGAAKYHAYPVSNGKRLELTLMDLSGSHDVELSVFMPSNPYFRELTATVSPGARFALFSFDSFVKNTGRVALSLSDESQLVPLEN